MAKFTRQPKSLNLLADGVKKLGSEMKILREENAHLEKKLRIRQFLKPSNSNSSSVWDNDATENDEHRSYEASLYF